MIEIAIELSVQALIVFLFLSQIVVPLFCSFPLFWLFSKEGRARVNFAVRCALASPGEKPKTPTNKDTKS